MECIETTHNKEHSLVPSFPACLLGRLAVVNNPGQSMQYVYLLPSITQSYSNVPFGGITTRCAGKGPIGSDV